MNLSVCPGLQPSGEGRIWYRAIPLRHASTPLSTIQTKPIATRFSPGYLAAPPDQFEILYLAEDSVTALYEHRAMFGTPFLPGLQVANPRYTPVVLNVSVQLQRIIDLTSPTGAQASLETNVQELTGDWSGYQALA